jgi:hypothetical protein
MSVGVEEQADARAVSSVHSVRLRFPRRLTCSRAQAWAAITDADQVEQWFPARIRGRLEPQAELWLRNRRGAWRRGVKVAVCDGPRLLCLDWGDALLVINLSGSAHEDCRLELLWAPRKHGQAPREAALWWAALDVLSFIASGETPLWTLERRFEQLREACSQRFGPQQPWIGDLQHMRLAEPSTVRA